MPARKQDCLPHLPHNRLLSIWGNINIDRRQFLKGALAGAVAARAAEKKRYRAAIIGHTGRGDYGHEWDTAWSGFDSIEVAAVADPVDHGRQKAMERSAAKRGYRDYREMLRKE